VNFQGFTKELTELSRKHKIEIFVTNTGKLYLGEMETGDNLNGEYKLTDGYDLTGDNVDYFKEIEWE
jgi:hypothetical protein